MLTDAVDRTRVNVEPCLFNIIMGNGGLRDLGNNQTDHNWLLEITSKHKGRQMSKRLLKGHMNKLDGACCSDLQWLIKLIGQIAVLCFS